MLLTEVFTAAFLVLLCITAILWLKRPHSRALAMLSGALLGLTALIRTQALLLAVVLLFLLFLTQVKRPRQLLLNALPFLAGLLIVVLFWMGRNAIQSGEFVFEDATYVNFTLKPLPDGAENQEGSAQIADTSLKFVRRMASHLTNSLASSLYQLPWEWDVPTDLDVYAARQLQQPFINFQLLNANQAISVTFHLFLLAVGLAGARKRSGIAGLVPAAVYLGYNLSGAIFGFSGWRFIQPVDWVLPIYWAAGILECILYLIHFPGKQAADLEFVSRPGTQIQPKKRLALSLVAVLAAGLLLPVGELCFPKAPESPTRSELFAQISQYNSSALTESLIALSEQTDTEIGKGMIFYPQFLEKEDDFPKNDIKDLNMVTPPVLFFDLISQHINRFVLPTAQKPDFVPHNIPAIVISCQMGKNHLALAVLVMGDEPAWIITDRPIPASCAELAQ
jgi:hypothetical protein